MNILFFYTESINPTRGGVERVTYTLSNYLCEKGHSVFFMSQHVDSDVDDSRQYILPCDKVLLCKENIDYMSSFSYIRGINIIINQGALNQESATFIQSCSFKNIRIISVIHNSLLAFADNFGIIHEKELFRWKLGFLTRLIDSNALRILLRYLYRIKKKNHYRQLIENSDALILLSRFYKDELKFLTGYDSKNVIAIPNPVCLPMDGGEKEKIALYVGRVNSAQKRVGTLIDIWSKVRHKDWTLIIVGEGESLPELERRVKEENISNIIFTGRCDPHAYYRKASIFCMTSSFEGLPMTLIESLSYGVVPVLFNTFSSASDIIKDSYNGFLIPSGDTEAYIEKLNLLVSDSELISKLSNNCYEASLKYNIENIGAIWLDLFNKVMQCYY